MSTITTYENLLNILAKAPGHIYWKDTKGIYQGSNNAQAIFLGYKTGKDLIGKTDFDLPWKEQANHLREIDSQVMKTQKEYCIEEIVSSQEGVETIFLSKKQEGATAKNINPKMKGACLICCFSRFGYLSR